VENSCVKQKGKKFLETFYQKSVFLIRATVIHLFEISAKFRFFDTFCRQYRELSLTTLPLCLEDKRSNKIETVQYFKEHFFIY
jgi:hypothetical protein